MSTKDAIKCLLAFVFVAAIIGAAVMGVSPRKIFALMISGAFLTAVIGVGTTASDSDGFY